MKTRTRIDGAVALQEAEAKLRMGLKAEARGYDALAREYYRQAAPRFRAGGDRDSAGHCERQVDRLTDEAR